MKIFISGISGFIGSRLATALTDLGHEVTGLAHKTAFENSKIKIIKGDITDSDIYVPADNYDIVIHLAALTPLEKNKKNLLKTNFEGTVNFFKKIKDHTKFFVYVSGLGVFGDPNSLIIDENSPLKPNTEYSKIRLKAQKFLEEKCKESSMPFTVVYLGEVYGNGGWFSSQIVTRLKNGKFKMPKGGDYFRCVVHVDDVISSLVKIVEKKLTNESYIITDSQPVLFKDFIGLACKELGVKTPGSIPTFLAKAVVGGDAIKLLTTSIKTSNKKISEITEFKFPSYKSGLKDVISKIN